MFNSDECHFKREAGDGVGLWKAKMLRITAFPTKNIQLGSRDFWSELEIGESEQQEKSKVSVSQQGPINDNWLVVTNAGVRVDWVYLPSPDAQQFGEFTDVGEFEDAAGWLLQLIIPWIEKKCPALNRLALGVVLNRTVGDRVEGYKEISAYLPFLLDGETSSDFSYQINRPTNSQLYNNIRINRVGKWSVTAMATIHGDALQNLSQLTLDTENAAFACEVTLDINTVPQVGLEITPAVAKDLLIEFMEIATRLAEKGDKQ